MSYRFCCLIACGIEAVRAAGRAMGHIPQDLFADGAVWLHWVAVISWAFVAARVAIWGTDE